MSPRLSHLTTKMTHFHVTGNTTICRVQRVMRPYLEALTA